MNAPLATALADIARTLARAHDRTVTAMDAADLALSRLADGVPLDVNALRQIALDASRAGDELGQAAVAVSKLAHEVRP